MLKGVTESVMIDRMIDRLSELGFDLLHLLTFQSPIYIS